MAILILCWRLGRTFSITNFSFYLHVSYGITAAVETSYTPSTFFTKSCPDLQALHSGAAPLKDVTQAQRRDFELQLSEPMGNKTDLSAQLEF